MAGGAPRQTNHPMCLKYKMCPISLFYFVYVSIRWSCSSSGVFTISRSRQLLFVRCRPPHYAGSLIRKQSVLLPQQASDELFICFVLEKATRRQTHLECRHVCSPGRCICSGAPPLLQYQLPCPTPRERRFGMPLAITEREIHFPPYVTVLAAYCTVPS